MQGQPRRMDDFGRLMEGGRLVTMAMKIEERNGNDPLVPVNRQ